MLHTIPESPASSLCVKSHLMKDGTRNFRSTVYDDSSTTVLVGARYKPRMTRGESRPPYITVYLVSRYRSSKPEYDWNIQFPTDGSRG